MTDKYKEQQAHLKQIIASKDAMEKEMEEWHSYLTTGAGARFGYNKPLVDEQGFPDSDVELILSVRQARNRIACLKTDLADIMKTIEKELYALHALGAEQKKLEQANPTNKPQSEAAAPPRPSIPFALVDQVSSDSPAQLAGLQVDDKIVAFGSVSISPTNPHVGLEAVGQVVRDSENKSIRVSVLRGDGNVDLTLIPKRWAGNGLLGCHLVPISPNKAT
eukprot:Phypoly_transcript_17618.p1 GENE.Phypoly_transcript_17618~~Phypoly_transcript_17618.p1  ORF type:complete len:220 (+),score=35.83 Phypoly_transcript_17618:74-733(+)